MMIRLGSQKTMTLQTYLILIYVALGAIVIGAYLRRRSRLQREAASIMAESERAGLNEPPSLIRHGVSVRVLAYGPVLKMPWVFSMARRC
jgi:hypothetical protein